MWVFSSLCIVCVIILLCANNYATQSSDSQNRIRVVQVQHSKPVEDTSSRMALVIGNATYGAPLGSLRNPANDAADMAKVLQSLNFSVTIIIDTTRQRMEESIAAFTRRLSSRSVGLFYFAGHGLQVDGMNYLVPIDARLEKATDVRFQTVAADWVLARMEEASNVLNIIILDACRNNPFVRQGRSIQRGLAPMQASHGSLIAYATAPGAVAADGTARNGLYTKYLLRFMTEPNLLIEQMLKQVRIAVEKETQGGQIPWEASSLREDFYFNPRSQKAPSGTNSAVSPPPHSDEATAQPKRQNFSPAP